jgi:hypothetical protein
MRALAVIVLFVALCDLTNLRDISGAEDTQTLLLIRPVISFDETIQIRTPRWQHGDLHPQTEPEPHKRRRKVAPARSSNKAAVTVEHDSFGQAVLPQCLGYRKHGRFSGVIITRLRIHQQGSACIYRVEHFHDMLLLALKLSRDSRGIFEVKLPEREGSRPLNRPMATFARGGNLTVLVEDAPNRSRGSWQALGEGPSRLRMMKVVKDGFGTWDALKIAGRVHADLEDAIDDGLAEPGRRVLASTGVTVEDEGIVRLSSQQPTLPFLDPTLGATNGLR